MWRLRCFIRNYGREKVIDLVNYRREREMASTVSTGTDGMIEETQRKRYIEKQREVQRYAGALHGMLSGTSTVRKIVYCKIELPKVANGNWRMLHLQIGESCKAFARSAQERCSA